MANVRLISEWANKKCKKFSYFLHFLLFIPLLWYVCKVNLPISANIYLRFVCFALLLSVRNAELCSKHGFESLEDALLGRFVALEVFRI